MSDEQSQELDARARKLLIDFHAIGDAAATNPSCAELDRLRSVAQQLREVTAAKFAHISLKVDQALKSRVASSRAAPAAPPEQRAPTPTNGTSRPPAAAPRPSAPPAASANSWRSGTSVTLAPKPDVMRSLPPVTMPVDVTYSVEEISQAGRGFFGTVSAGLASVIQFAFENYGRPNGYILGTEGGGAFLAGLSYGEGRLVTKQFPEQEVYWQGPTIGYDVGATGSRVMVLVYNLNRADQIFTRFAGLGGSAFVVGGAGITYHQRGSLVLAPIRTGLGLRLGANIGYLKFTPRPTFNPF